MVDTSLILNDYKSFGFFTSSPPKRSVGIAFYNTRVGTRIGVIRVKRVKGKAQTIGACEWYEDWSEVLANVPKNLPVHVAICMHKAMLTKFYEDEPSNSSSKQLLAQIFPGAALTDFSLATVKVSTSKKTVHLIRHEEIDKLKRELFTNFPFLITTSIGFEGVNSLKDASQLNIEEESYSEEVILGKEVELGGDCFSLAILPALAGAIGLLGMDCNTAAPINLKAFSSFKLSVIILLTGVISLIVLGGGGAQMANRYKAQNQLVQVQLGALAKQSDLAEIELEKESENAYLKADLGLVEHSYAAIFTDRTLSAIPDGIKLNAITTFPPKRQKIRLNDAEIQGFANDRISLSGVAKEYADFQQLLEELQAKPWVLETKHKNLSAKAKGVDFELELILERAGIE